MCRHSQPGSWEKSKECASTVYLRRRFQANLHPGRWSHYPIATVRSNRSPAKTSVNYVTAVSVQQSALANRHTETARTPCSPRTRNQARSQCKHWPSGKLYPAIGRALWTYLQLLRPMDSCGRPLDLHSPLRLIVQSFCQLPEKLS